MFSARQLAFPALLLLVLVLSAVNVSGSPAPPTISLSCIYVCPPKDLAGHKLSNADTTNDAFIVCDYGEKLSNGQEFERTCDYNTSTGNLGPVTNDQKCTQTAATSCTNAKHRREDNFTAQKRKLAARAAAPKVSVPDYMHSRQVLGKRA